MPISVYEDPMSSPALEEETKSVALLCGESWDLPSQLFEFERWLETDGESLPRSHYVADIGFSPRQSACGGGGTLSVAAMQIRVMVGMEVWFSEYPA